MAKKAFLKKLYKGNYCQIDKKLSFYFQMKHPYVRFMSFITKTYV